MQGKSLQRPNMAYYMKPRQSTATIPYLPIIGELKDGRQAVIDLYKAEEHEADLHRILKRIVEDGDAYPQESVDSVEEFRAFYTTFDVFVCKDYDTGKVFGAFYVKPNYPGRSSHYSNGGFIVDHAARGRGVGQFMGRNYLYIARDLGYRASLFNLVYVSNVASLRLWRKLGFTELAVLPKVGNLKGQDGYVDAIQFYYDLTTVTGHPVNSS
ncbi:uncharacterized protein LOC141908840 [Tubulanus polymorphus]|uniref:uncharacterized protein LOC141908840 n=1 Tax=Tubulanus polymorphus TaxID=672921 RepID=UPI003DA66E43